MTNMYLENRLLLEGNEEAALAHPIELEYYLVESDIDSSDEPAVKKVYGIGIIKKTKEECSEGKLVTDFSVCITRTREVLKRLVNNTVTPVALHNILEDIISV